MAGAMWFIYATQALMFLAGVYLAWQFFQETELLPALRLGLSAAVPTPSPFYSPIARYARYGRHARSREQ
jgi:hypothetical protein